MKISAKLLLGLTILVVFVINSCKKADTNPSTTTPVVTKPKLGTLTFNFVHKAGNSDFLLNSTAVPLFGSNTLKASLFNYYISNIQLITEKGDTVLDGFVYHLIEATSTSNITKVVVDRVPYGNYKGFNFHVGIDSASNHSTDNVGDLDIGNHMSWTWNTGYKFLSIEGTATNSSGAREGIIYHVGSDEAYTMKDFSTGNNAKPFVMGDGTPTLNFNVDVSKFADDIDVISTYSIMSAGPENRLVMNNFSNKCLQFVNFENK